MNTYHNTAGLKFDDPTTGNAASGALVTVRVNSTQGLASIFDVDEVAIANPLTADSDGNYAFKILDGVYDVIIREGEANEVVLTKVQLSEPGSGVLGYATKAIMDADLTPTDQSVALVTNDATSTNNGNYTKIGASGVGSWLAAFDDLANQAFQLATESEKETRVSRGGATHITGDVTFNHTGGNTIDMVFSATAKVYVYPNTEASYFIDVGGLTFSLQSGQLLTVHVTNKTVQKINTSSMASVYINLALNLGGLIKSGTLSHLSNSTKFKESGYRGDLIDFSVSVSQVTLTLGGTREFTYMAIGDQVKTTVTLSNSYIIEHNEVLYILDGVTFIESAAASNAKGYAKADATILAFNLSGRIIGGYLRDFMSPQEENPIVALAYIRHAGVDFERTDIGTTVTFGNNAVIYKYNKGFNSGRVSKNVSNAPFPLVNDEALIMKDDGELYTIDITSTDIDKRTTSILFLCINGIIVAGDLFSHYVQKDYAGVPHTVKPVKNLTANTITTANNPNGLCVVGNELWQFGASTDESATLDGEIKRFSLPALSLLSTHTHNWGHCNSVEYNEEIDAIVLGNGSGNNNLYGKILIIEDLASWEASAAYDKAVIAKIIDLTALTESKTNVIWGCDNLSQNNEIFILSNDLAKIQRAYLGRGSNDFSLLTDGYGVLLTVGATEFNGTVLIKETFTNPIDVDVIQGATFTKDGLMIATGHDGFHVWLCDFADGYANVKLTEHTYSFLTGDGGTDTIGFHEGLAHKDGVYYTLIGGGTAPEINGKLYEFSI
jgi:hypothetical protein